jgi:hypothetical protein
LNHFPHSTKIVFLSLQGEAGLYKLFQGSP